MGLEDRLLHKLQERQLDRLMRRFGSIQWCPWCRQCAQSGEGWSFEVWKENPFHDVLECGVCRGTSVWHFGMGYMAIGPLDPPRPRHDFPNNVERDSINTHEEEPSE